MPRFRPTNAELQSLQDAIELKAGRGEDTTALSNTLKVGRQQQTAPDSGDTTTPEVPSE